LGADLEFVNGKDCLFLIHLNHHFVPSVVVQILIVTGDDFSPVLGEFKPKHKLPVFESEFEEVVLTAVVGVKQKPIGIPGFKLEADGAVQTSLPARVLHVRIIGPVREKGRGGGDGEEEPEGEEERRFEHGRCDAA